MGSNISLGLRRNVVSVNAKVESFNAKLLGGLRDVTFIGKYLTSDSCIDSFAYAMFDYGNSLCKVYIFSQWRWR